MDIKLLFLIAVLTIVTAVVFYFFYKTYLKKQVEKSEPRRTREQQEIEFDAELRHEYHLALHSGNKEKAFAIGRKYYQTIHDSEKFIDDIEQAISNDLSTIRKA